MADPVGTVQRAAIYCRISQDRDRQELGVRRQLKLAHDLVSRRGNMLVVGELVDDDVSAYLDRHRPGYETLMRMVAAGEIDVVIVYQTSRLWRDRVERANGIKQLQRAVVSVLAVKGPDLDMSTAYGRAMAGLLGEFDTMESEVKSERQRAKARELAEQGKVSGGGTRPFGFESDRLTLRESEADLVRDVTDRILRTGQTLHGICGEWNGRGISTVTGKQWTPHVLRRMLMSARISGRREHRGVIVADAVWPAIISAQDSDRLRELLSDPDRTTNGGDSARRYLLSGFLGCGLPDCTLRLRARPTATRKRSYVCATIGQAHLRIDAEPLELFVTEAAFDYLDEFVDLAAALRSDADGGREAQLWVDLATYQRRLDDAESRFYVHGKMTERSFQRVSAELERELTRVRIELARVSQRAALETLPTSSTHARALWSERGLEWRRNLLRTLVTDVIVGPGVRGLNRFDERRVTINWRRPGT